MASIVRTSKNRQNGGRQGIGEKGYINRYEYTENTELKILRFEKMAEEWLDFIISCRSGQAHQYDIVEGPMADDTIYNYLQNYLDGKISRSAFWELVKFKYPHIRSVFIQFRHWILWNLQEVRSYMAKKNNNNLFFTCSLIEYIGRNRKQHRREITDYLGQRKHKENIRLCGCISL